ncbi:hypothetical protein GCM10022384_51430 [Streptomyces marokkonensis]|uniref:Uncharacterized protein n=1 Tax=Streptomyces marokkonensis TaxID=324855 RepID=A0ABP7RIN6_9ACTN
MAGEQQSYDDAEESDHVLTASFQRFHRRCSSLVGDLGGLAAEGGRGIGLWPEVGTRARLFTLRKPLTESRP